METICYAGTFSPPTLGHRNMIERGLKIAPKIIVAVVDTPAHKKPMFTTEQRIAMCELMCEDLENVQVTSFKGLLAPWAKNAGADGLLRGLRAVTDFEYEMAMAHANRDIEPDLETVWVPTNPEYSYISSSLVREVMAMGGDYAKWLDPRVAEYLANR